MKRMQRDEAVKTRAMREAFAARDLPGDALLAHVERTLAVTGSERRRLALSALQALEAPTHYPEGSGCDLVDRRYSPTMAKDVEPDTECAPTSV